VHSAPWVADRFFIVGTQVAAVYKCEVVVEGLVKVEFTGVVGVVVEGS
jgi:hypothetical protein